MKSLQDASGKIGSAKVAVFLGLTIGLGLSIHPAFLLVAAVIAISALLAKIIHVAGDHAQQTRLAYRAR